MDEVAVTESNVFSIDPISAARLRLFLSQRGRRETDILQIKIKTFFEKENLIAKYNLHIY